jgi:AraC-like DNA-binding protein
MPIEIVEMETREPEIAHEAIDALYSPERGISYSGSTAGFHCELRFASASHLGVDRLRHTMSAHAVMPVEDVFIASTVIDGEFTEFAAEGESRRLTRGDVTRYPIHGELEATWEDVSLALIRMPLSLLQRVADERSGSPVASLRFLSLSPVSPAAARAWRSLTRFLNREVSEQGGMLENPLIEQRLSETTAAAALTTFPNTVMRTDTEVLRRGAPPAAVRRAVAFIEASAAEPITISDIATAAGVTPRSVQYGFARHMDMTPMAYLQRVRLGFAHRDLKAADPADGVTVVEVARRWGFTKASRFAGEYRTVYGQPPSLTLRS